jgi:hypothetical protein
MKIDVDKTDDATNYLSQKSKYDEKLFSLKCHQ